MPGILRSCREFTDAYLNDPPENPTLLWLFRHAQEGAITKAILGLDEGRHLVSLCAQDLGVPVKETKAIKDLQTVRNHFVTHTRVIRTGASGQQKFLETLQRFAGPQVLDLLDQASHDLLLLAQVVMKSPGFLRTPVSNKQREELRKDELETLVQALKESGLY